MREKSGSIACSEQEQSGNEATAPGGDVTADRAGIKKQRILLEVRHAYKDYIIMHREQAEKL